MAKPNLTFEPASGDWAHWIGIALIVLGIAGIVWFQLLLTHAQQYQANQLQTIQSQLTNAKSG
ncbi:MAG: hypothetical protein Q7R47_06335, partial [Candidatus Diapherotrites archaeon]|nr:hypothetical protein [Candidatus Diapherotrites archaeon]